MRLIGLKDLSLVADDTGIISKILMMLYIAGYKTRFVACRTLNSLSVLSSTRVHLISNAQSHPQNLLFLVNLSVRYLTIYQLFQVLCLEDLQGLDKMSPPKKNHTKKASSLFATRFDISSTKWSTVSKKTRYRDIFQKSDGLSTE